MFNTTSKSTHHRHPEQSSQRLSVGARVVSWPLWVLLAACSGSPVSLGSGLDSDQAALTRGDSDDAAGASADCGVQYNECLASASVTGEDPARCEMQLAGCRDGASAEVEEDGVDCGAQYNECLASASVTGEDPARCEMQLAGCRESASVPPRM